MSILRVWLVLLTLVCGLGIALAMLAPRGVGEQLDVELDNRLERSQYAAALLLRVNARKWIDTSGRIASDAVLAESLDQATRGPADLQLVHKTVQDRLRSFAEQMEQMKVDLLLSTDARGRVIARVGVDATVYKDGIEGYPLMVDALRGLRGDDTWSIAGKLYRVAASPVVLHDRYVGAVVIGQEVTNELAESMKAMLKTDVVVLLRGRVIASTAALPILDQLPAAAAAHGGRSNAMTVGGYAVVFGSFVGEASEHQAAFALCAPRAPVVTLPALVRSLVNRDPHTLPWRALVPVGASALVALVLGLVLVSLLGSRPQQRLARDAQALARGELPRMPDTSHRGDLGDAARAINSTVERITNRVRAEARLAQLEPNPQAAARNEEPAPRVSAPAPRVVAPAIEQPSPRAAKSLPLSDKSPAPEKRTEDFDESQTDARASWSSKSSAGSYSPSLFSHSMTPLPPPMVVGDTTEPVPMETAAEPPKTLSEALTEPAPPPEPIATVPNTPVLPPTPKAPERVRGFDESTAVESPSEALLIASAHGTSDEIEADFQRVFDEFIATRQHCGETMEGVTFDKFSVKLRQNRSQLMERYGCSSVRFQVYIKDGKTALKATPST